MGFTALAARTSLCRALLVVADCCDALELAQVDLIANDTGGAIAQVFAAGNPDRLHTLTLTNCEAHDNLPPRGLRMAHLIARADQAAGLGVLARIGPRLGRTPKARRRGSNHCSLPGS